MTSSWEPPGPPAQWSAPGRPAFVGRAAEVAALEAAWSAVVAGSRQVVFVGGEPGAGKTRLVTEIAVEVSRLGAAVLSGQCPAGLGAPYQPFDRPAEVLLNAIDDGRLAPIRGEPADVTRHLSVLAGDLDADAAVRGIDERRARYEAFLSALTAAATGRPLVLVLDDLHRAGGTALQLLSYVVERAADLPLFVLVTHRTTTPDRSEELVGHVSNLYRLDGVRRIDLPPLDTDSITNYLMAEGRVGRTAAAQAAVILRDRTGGNPFYLREVWRDLELQGGVRALYGLRRATPAVSDALSQRIRELTTPQRTTLTIAAVLGEEVQAHDVVPLVRAVGGVPALDDLVGAGLLEVAEDRPGAFRFVHALVRQATLDALSSFELAEHHERVALLLESRGTGVRRLAHHFAGAALLGHADAAVRCLLEAGEMADRSLAHSEAAGLFRQAAHHSSEAGRRDHAIARAAHSHLLACEFGEARDLYRSLLDSADDEVALAAAIWFEEASWFTAEPGAAAGHLLQSAMARAQVDDSHDLYLPAVAGLARSYAHSGDPVRAEELIAPALDAARKRQDDAVLGKVLAAAVHIGTRPPWADVKRARADELTDVAARTGQWLLLGPAAYHRSVIAYQQGDASGFAQARVDLGRTAIAAGQRYWNLMADCAGYAAALIEGRFNQASAAAERLMELGATFTGGEIDGVYGVQSFMLRRETGAIDHVRPLVTGKEHLDGHWPPALLALYVELGLEEPARRVLVMLTRRVAAENRESATYPALLGFLAEAAISLEDREAAAAVRPLLAEHSGLNLVMGPFAAVFGAADRFLAELDRLLGAPAGELFESALALDVRTGSVLHQAHTLAAWSALPGDPARSAQLRKQAHELADQYGLVRVRRRLDAMQSRPQPTPGGLSAREREVLRLLGSGLSNREIARALVISEHTAANHVRNIMTKTGCTNRTQAAMFASSHGLLA